MKKIATGFIYSLLAICATAQADSPKPLDPLPSPQQLAWQRDELTMFVHFGMDTFTGKSIGSGQEDEKTFNPTDLDCKQWVQTAKECGFKGMILTAKHHDGFCLWPTESTDHSVKKSDWKDGKGDVVREFSDACKDAGIKMGIYCSPYDRSVPFYDTDRPKYSQIYQKQLTELLSNYGPVYEMWFDGNKANVADWPNVVDLVRKLQPNAVIKQGPSVTPVREDLRWVGNEQACAPLANWSVYPSPDDPQQWFPRECDTIMIGGWFWNDKPPVSLDTLLNYYYTSVGRNSILLLNVAPDKRGKFSDESVLRLHEFHDALTKIFANDLANAKTVTQPDDKTFEVDLGSDQDFNVVRMEEPIELGQRVAEYKLEVFSGGDWKTVNNGFTIGYRKLDRFPKITGSRIRLTITKSRAAPIIKSIGVYLDTVSPPESFEPANANHEIIRKKP